MILFRKRLLLDTDPLAISRAKLILQKNGIPFEEKTTTSENAMSRRFNSAAAANVYMSYDKMSRQAYIYRLYVPIRKYSEAKRLVFGK